ncbi:MAG TPA: ABC transporter substrate-binding protein [Candidatus Binatia bacterium]|nr:ABC transporter substrate-binding protein [Candidatus Binatia bacterium]
MRRNARSLCYLFCLLAASGLCTPRPAHADDIVIGMSAAFSGPSASLGIELYRGSMAYIAHVNSTGGVNGRKLVLKAYDDQYDPVSAVENTITLVEKDHAFLLFDYVGTPTVTRVLPLLKRYSDRHVSLFFPYTGAQPQREPPYDAFVFNLRASYRQETEGLVDHFVRMGRKRIAVLYQADAYGRSGWDGVRRALQKYALEMAGEATYSRGATYDRSFREQVEILRQANPDAVIVIGAYAASAAFIRDARDANWDLPIANLSFVGSLPMLQLLRESSQSRGKDYTTNLINSQVVPSYDDTSFPAVRQYRELMDRYNPRPPAELVKESYPLLHYSFVSFEGFLNAKLLVEILQRVGTTADQAAVNAAVEKITAYDIGIGTPVSFGPDKHQGLDTVYYTTVRGDEFIPINDWQRWQP